jgi:hypothetical protein
MLEDSLRESFASQVELTPSASARVDEVIRRGRRVRKRRLAGAWAGSVVAFVALIAGTTVWQAIARPRAGGESTTFSADLTGGADPTPMISINPGDVAGIGLDLRIDSQLWTTDGRRIDMSGVGDVTAVFRVPAGWVYGGAEGVQLLTNDGFTATAGAATGWAVSADGHRIAYVAGTQLVVAAIGTGGFRTTERVAVPAGTAPAALLGDRVLVSAPTRNKARGYGYVGFDGTTATPTLNTTVLAVYGTRSDVAAGLVQFAGRGACVAALRPEAGGLVVTRGADCRLSVPDDAAAQPLSPDGGWLAESRADGLHLMNVDSALAGRSQTVDCPARGARQPAWIDPNTVAAASDRGVVRCRTDGSHSLVPLPSGVGGSWQLVPRLGTIGG